jgi:hypothetical protein
MDHFQLTSNKKFGYLFSGIFFLIGCFGYLKSVANLVVYCFLFTSFLIAIVSIAAPSYLSKLNKAWFLLGQALGKLVSPIVLGVIFFLLITPIGIITRIFGRDELCLNKRHKTSYWKDRKFSAEMDSNPFKNQF